MVTAFEDLKAWQLARKFNIIVYSHTRNQNFKKDYGLKDQFQRASVSIMLNIAEGFNSGSRKSFVNFLRYSYRSTAEVKSIMYIALDLEYITIDEFKLMNNHLDELQRVIAGLLKRTLNVLEK